MLRSLLAGALLLLVLVVPAEAKKPVKPAAQAPLALTITPVTPAFGDSIVLTATGVPEFSFVHVQCFHDGELVLDAYRGLNDTSHSYLDPLLLSNTVWGTWTSGAGECTADVGYWPNGSWSSLLVESFAVTP